MCMSVIPTQQQRHGADQTVADGCKKSEAAMPVCHGPLCLQVLICQANLGWLVSDGAA